MLWQAVYYLLYTGGGLPGNCWLRASLGHTWRHLYGQVVSMGLVYNGFKPDCYDIIDAVVALIGVCIIYYAPSG